MPNIDAGHYFLTVLLPISTEPVEIYDHVRTTPMLAVREWLAGLPTAHQSPVCVSADNSPFARNTRNHFARLAVIDVPAFNGRLQDDAVAAIFRRINPVVPRPVDRLSTPYLFFSADFDCIYGDDRDLESYLATLWATMEPEIRRIFQYCYGFEDVISAASFAAFIKRGQVETTMPFHDYWSTDELEKLPGVAKPLVIGAASALLLFAAIIIAAAVAHIPFWGWLVLVPVLIAAIVAGLYLLVMSEGKKPFPPAHGADLRGVLKSLYLQKEFTRFAIANQGLDADALYAAFAAFVHTHQPSHTTAPAQAPGVVGA